MKSIRDLKGCGTALVTPFKRDGSLDEEALQKLVAFQIREGIDFLVPCGTTGESVTLRQEEHLRVVELVVQASRKSKTPVIAGAGGYHTEHVIEMARKVAKTGADGILSVTPYYNKPTQEGLYQHFKAIAEEVDLPLILYNVPGRTVADLANDTTLRLAQVPGIVGIKDATGNLERGIDLIKRAPAGFAIYSGDDATGCEFMLRGGDGVISVTNNVAPRLMAQMCAAALGGDRCAAMGVNAMLGPLHHELFVQSNPIPVKWAVFELGLASRGIRLPLTWLTEELQPRVRQAMRHAGIN